MIARVRRIAQITLLTTVLVFGSLLLVGSFDTPVWSHGGHHHTWSKKVSKHKGGFWIYWGSTETTTVYYDPGC